MSRVWAVAAALARILMILSSKDSLKSKRRQMSNFTSLRGTRCSFINLSNPEPADMKAWDQTPGSFSFRCWRLLQNLAGQTEGCSCQVHRQERHTLAVHQRQLQKITSHPNHLATPKTLQGYNFRFLCHLNGQIYLSATVSNGSKQNEEVQRWAVGQIKLEPAEDFPFHPQQLVLRIRVVHQVAKSRHLKKK